MLKQFRLQTACLSSALLLSLLLAACGVAPPSTPAQSGETGAAATTQSDNSLPETEQAATTSTAEPAAQQPTAIAQVTEAAATTEATTAAGQTPAASASAEATCQPVEIPSNDLIAPVSDQDWSKGPADAPVTLIEYGDFQ